MRAGTLILWESLDGRRTTNAQFKNTELGLRDDFFFVQQADRGKDRSRLIGTGHRAGAVRHRADRAGC